VTHDLFLLETLKFIPAVGRTGRKHRMSRVFFTSHIAVGRGRRDGRVTNSAMPGVRTTLVLMNSFDRHSCHP